MNTMDKKLIYVLCTVNSCRSQVADGFLNELGGDQFEMRSADVEAMVKNEQVEVIVDLRGEAVECAYPAAKQPQREALEKIFSK
jgi:protein-tyrosine-phosphatase